MKRIANILVPCDFSDDSIKSIQYAVELAESVKASITVVHVINQRDLVAVTEAMSRVSAFGGGASMSIDQYLDQLKNERSHLIQKLLGDTMAAGRPVKKIIRVGVPFRELLKAVHESGADLVVMGTKGRSNLAEVVFGSTADKVLRHCPVPLLSIRSKAADAQHGKE